MDLQNMINAPDVTPSDVGTHQRHFLTLMQGFTLMSLQFRRFLTSRAAHNDVAVFVSQSVTQPLVTLQHLNVVFRRIF